MTLTAAFAILRRFWWALPMLALLAWGLRVDSLRATYKGKWQDVTTEYAAFKTAIVDKTAEALAAQKAVNAAKESEYQEKAREADQSIDDLRARLALRLRQGSGGGSSRAAGAAAQGDDTAVPESLPASPPGTGGSVQVDADTLAGLSAYAIKAHEWAVSLENDK